MANIKSQKKRILTNEKRRVRNLAVRSELKTRVKSARAAITENSEEASTAVSVAQKRLAKAAANGTLHKRTAARRTSRLMKAATKTSAAS